MVTILVDEFDREAIKAYIWEVTRVQTLIHYRAIYDGITKCDNKSQPRVKALHIKVDKADPATSRNRIKPLYSSKATISP